MCEAWYWPKCILYNWWFCITPRPAFYWEMWFNIAILKEGVVFLWVTHSLIFCLQAVLVHTSETVRFRYFVDLLMEHRRPVMLVGSAGSGKTILINDKLSGELRNSCMYYTRQLWHDTALLKISVTVLWLCYKWFNFSHYNNFSHNPLFYFT